MGVLNLALDAIGQIIGYTFDLPSLLDDIENAVVITYGHRNRDRLPVVAKLSQQPLRLEREYHIVQRLYKHESTRPLLCKPLDKIILSHGFIAFVYEYYGNNILDECQSSILHHISDVTKSNPMTLDMPTPPLDDAEEDYMSSIIPFLTVEKFLDFAIQCCNCLETVHKNQIVHGEIKLNAFLWPDNNNVKIWNFGSGSRSLETSLTSEGWRKSVYRNGITNFQHMLIYMSPEQTGRTAFQPDHRTDLYSLGITFFVVLTQTLPFTHNSPMEILHNVLNKKLPFVHEVRPDTPVIISQIIEKLTNKNLFNHLN
ncbi:kinase-like domain-containing protein [Pilobolus umbonatus]|nr:kinase-like domain-containing protein [Pilobolus umbonatus]